MADGTTHTVLILGGRRSGRTWARVLNAAKARFERHGFEDAAMRDIAADAGVTTGVIYHHAKSKSDLLRQVVAVCPEIRPAVIAKLFGEEPETQKAADPGQGVDGLADGANGGRMVRRAKVLRRAWRR